jgi:ribosomal protein L11 methyltransferase
MEEISSDENLEMQKVYFNDLDTLQYCKKNIEMLISRAVILHSGSVDYSDWESFLHGGFEPLAIDSLFVVPSENPPPIPEGLKPLYIIPGRGFGTGGHATTRLVLRALTRHVRPGMRVLDVGTGSGILAIAACLLGAEQAFGVDTDADAVENARENVERNGMSDRIELAVGSIEQATGGTYPLVCANIIAHVLGILFKENLADLIEPGGTIITAGILEGEKGDLVEIAASKGIRMVTEDLEGEWNSIVFRRE